MQAKSRKDELPENGAELLGQGTSVDSSHIEELKDPDLGACYGTLGQVYAFMGTEESRDLAEECCFKLAIPFFERLHHIERQWVYLGHLACDMARDRAGGETSERECRGRRLWLEVQEHLPQLVLTSPAVKSGQQFVLALQLKGAYVFSEIEEILILLREWERVGPIDQFSEEETREHPFGLIWQAVALLYARAWLESGRTDRHRERALNYFDSAIAHLREGGPILQLLSQIARIRKAAFQLESKPDEKWPEPSIIDAVRHIEAISRTYFGERVWCLEASGSCSGYIGKHDSGPNAPPRERARGILKAIHFNYW